MAERQRATPRSARDHEEHRSPAGIIDRNPGERDGILNQEEGRMIEAITWLMWVSVGFLALIAAT